MIAKLMVTCFLAASVAQANVVAVATHENIRLELHNTAGPCQGRALWAVITDGTRAVSGCWVQQPPDQIAVAWMDGGYTTLPIGVFHEPEKL